MRIKTFFFLLSAPILLFGCEKEMNDQLIYNLSEPDTVIAYKTNLYIEDS